jgi:hypothetical protein
MVTHMSANEQLAGFDVVRAEEDTKRACLMLNGCDIMCEILVR